MQPLRAQVPASGVTRSQKDENSSHNGEGMVRDVFEEDLGLSYWIF